MKYDSLRRKGMKKGLAAKIARDKPTPKKRKAKRKK